MIKVRLIAAVTCPYHKRYPDVIEHWLPLNDGYFMCEDKKCKST